MRSITYSLLVFALAVLLPIPLVSAGEFKLEPGFMLLFNGKNLDGWREKKLTVKDKANIVFQKFGNDVSPDKLAEEIKKIELPPSLGGKTEAFKGRFKVVEGKLVYDPKVGGDRYIETTKEFAKDVHIIFDFKPGPACNNDILFRGTKFDIVLQPDEKKQTKENKRVKLGEWTAFELIAKGDKIEHKIAGETVRTTKAAAKSSPLMLRAEFGVIEIKNIRAKE